MNKDNLNVTMLAVLAIGLAVGQAQAQTSVFSETFDGAGFANGQLDGQGGWTADTQISLGTGSLGGNAVSELGHAESRGAGAPGNIGNFSATHALPQTYTGGILVATAFINASCGSCAKGGSLILSDGGSTNVLEVEALGGPSSQFRFISSGGGTTVIQPFPSVPPLLTNAFNGSLASTFDDAAWVQVEIEYNLNTGSATGRLRDVVEFNNHPNIVLSSDVAELSFPGFTPFNVNTVGFHINTPNNSINNPGRVDNIDVTLVPEPATAGTLLLGMVALLMLRRRVSEI